MKKLTMATLIRRTAKYGLIIIFLLSVNDSWAQKATSGKRAKTTSVSVKKKTIKKQDAENKAIDAPVQEMPQFPGGKNALYEFLSKSIIYPSVAKEQGIQGRVIVRFTVQKDGRVSDVLIVKSLDSSVDEEAIRVVKSMPKWTPGKQKGYPVKVRMVIPVVFKLAD